MTSDEFQMLYDTGVTMLPCVMNQASISCQHVYEADHTFCLSKRMNDSTGFMHAKHRLLKSCCPIGLARKPPLATMLRISLHAENVHYDFEHIYCEVYNDCAKSRPHMYNIQDWTIKCTNNFPAYAIVACMHPPIVHQRHVSIDGILRKTEIYTVL